MIDTSTISIIVGVFIGLGVLAAGLGFSFSQFKQGGGKAKDDLIVTLKESATIERDKAARLAEEKTQLLRSHQVQITALTRELAELKGRFDEQTKKAEEYKALLLNRDPELQKTLSEIRGYLKQLTTQSNINQSRNEEIDQDTQAEEGNVLRKKS